MLVGNSKVSVADVEKHCQSTGTFLDFADSLVPEEFKHVQAIIDNQRYLCCLLLRRSTKYPYDKKAEIIENVMSNVSIVGYVNDIEDVSSIYSLVDYKRLEEYRRRGV